MKIINNNQITPKKLTVTQHLNKKFEEYLRMIYIL